MNSEKHLKPNEVRGVQNAEASYAPLATGWPIAYRLQREKFNQIGQSIICIYILNRHKN